MIVDSNASVDLLNISQRKRGKSFKQRQKVSKVSVDKPPRWIRKQAFRVEILSIPCCWKHFTLKILCPRLRLGFPRFSLLMNASLSRFHVYAYVGTHIDYRKVLLWEETPSTSIHCEIGPAKPLQKAIAYLRS